MKRVAVGRQLNRAALSCLLLTGSASATFAPTLSLADQAKKAEVVVQATVTGVSSQQRDGQRWTVYRLRVSETLVGNVADLPKLENDPALWVLEGLDGAPSFKQNDEAVLLLYRGLLDSPVVGLGQGAYAIKNGQVQAGAGQLGELKAFKESLVSARGNK